VEYLFSTRVYTIEEGCLRFNH